MLPGCYETDSSEDNPNRTCLFTIQDQPGALDKCLHVFKDAGLNLKHIESRPSKTSKFDYDFTVELDIGSPLTITKLINDLEKAGAKSVKVVGGKQASTSVDDMVPWFPRKMSDLDSFATKTLEYGSDLSSDHPGFTDETYRKRRAEITEIAKKYRTYKPYY